MRVCALGGEGNGEIEGGRRKIEGEEMGFLLLGESRCVIRSPWNLMDELEEVADISQMLNLTFHHVRRLANGVADCLSKEGFLCRLMIS